MRIDKFIWACRIYKTRSIATKNCNTEKVKLNDKFTKASKSLNPNDVISVKFNPIWRKYKVLDFPKSRISANLVPGFIIEITPKDDLELLNEFLINQREMKLSGFRGRPTKLDRRNLDKFKS